MGIEETKKHLGMLINQLKRYKEENERLRRKVSDLEREVEELRQKNQQIMRELDEISRLINEALNEDEG